MKNVTVSIDDETHRRARVRAAERGTSLSAIVRDFLRHFSGEETEFDRLERLEHDTLASIRSFRAADRLPRDQVHDRAVR